MLIFSEDKDQLCPQKKGCLLSWSGSRVSGSMYLKLFTVKYCTDLSGVCWLALVMNNHAKSMHSIVSLSSSGSHLEVATFLPVCMWIRYFTEGALLFRPAKQCPLSLWIWFFFLTDRYIFKVYYTYMGVETQWFSVFSGFAFLDLGHSSLEN